MFLASGYIALTICVSVLYYHVFCVRYVDADRMYQEMENALYKGNGYLFELYGINPFSALLILLPALVGLPYLIKSIAAFVYFGCMFLLAWKLRKKFSPVSIFLAVLFLLCTLDLSYPADGIRFPMACMIFCSALVLNKYNNLSRINTTVLVLIACLLAADKPVIIWNKAALAPFVVEQGVGVAVESLQEAMAVEDGMTQSEYARMVRRASQLGQKLREGWFTREVMTKVQTVLPSLRRENKER